MKKLIFYLMALLLPLSTFEMSADDESAVIKVPLIVEHESFVAINWGWDGSGMYSGTEPIWYNADVINWTVGSHTFTSVDGMVYGFAKIS